MHKIHTESSRHSQDRWIVEHATLVNKIARHLIARLPAHIQLDDLIQAGMIGLLEAAQKYDPHKGASFETFAGIRIRGAMLDEVRRHEWIPRTLCKQKRLLSSAEERVEQKAGRAPEDSELAKELQMDLNLLHQLKNELMQSKLEHCRIEGISNFPTPLEVVQKMALQRELTFAISNLPEKESLVLSLYYDEELNLKEIGQVIGVSESRVCQIHNQAMTHLQISMQAWQ